MRDGDRPYGTFTGKPLISTNLGGPPLPFISGPARRQWKARHHVYRIAPVTLDNERDCLRRNGIGAPGLSEGTNSIRVPFLALVLLSNHVVYKDLPTLMDILYYP